MTTVKTSDFKSALESAQKFAPKNSAVGIIKKTAIHLESDKIAIQTTSLESGFIARVAAHSDYKPGFVFDAKAMIKAIGLASDQIEIHDPECAVIVDFTSGKMRLSVKTESLTEFPVMPQTPKNRLSIGVKTKDFQYAMKMALPTACKEDNRPVLTTVNLQSVDNEITLYTSDGFRATKQKMIGHVWQELPQWLINIPVNHLKNLLSVLPDDETMLSVYVSEVNDLNGHKIYFVWDESGIEYNVYINLMDGKFPDVTTLIKFPENWVMWDKNAIQQALKALPMFLVSVKIVNQCALYGYISENCDVLSVDVSDYSATICPDVFSVNPDYISDALKTAAKNPVEIGINGNVLYIQHGSTLIFIMGMNVR